MKRASVIINTYNRATYLASAIQSIARQTFPHVELIVVNGPSTDDTETVLDELAAAGNIFKRAHCASRNLSESRNIGLRQASGEVAFFIDDDAVAHREWISRLIRRYDDPQVGAAGGFTFDHTGVAYQCRYTVCDRFGNAQYFDQLDPVAILSDRRGFYYPSLLGTNCSFSMDALESVGGFDEVFAYMLDETDVCLRIFESGLQVATVPNAYVFHKYAPSHTRSADRIPTSLYAPARSKAYFCLKHIQHRNQGQIEALEEIDRYKKDISFANRWHLDHQKIGPAQYAKLSSELSDGVLDGIREGMTPVKTSETRTFFSGNTKTPYLEMKLPERNLARPLKIYFVSQGYPPADTSGIARWTHECAVSLSARGHEIHVITRSQTKANHVDFRDGVWIHSVVDLLDDELALVNPIPLPTSVLRRASAVLREIRRSIGIWGADIVSTPIWDLEGILCHRGLNVPVVTSLHTTYKLSLPFKPEWRKDAAYRENHVDRIIAGEEWLLKNSVQLLANSREIVTDLHHNHGAELALEERAVVVPHGLGMPLPRDEKLPAAQHGRRLKILFVGRLEPRKGPDQLLKALSRIRHLGKKFEVCLVGKAIDESGDYFNELQSLQKRLCKDISIHCTGYLSDDELQAQYASADIFIAPSRYESFGLILLEAMRHGVPVVACDIGGMRELIANGETGYLFNVDDIDALAEVLRRLIEDQGLRQRIGEAGRRNFESHYTSSAMAASLEKFFNKTILEAEIERGRA